MATSRRAPFRLRPPEPPGGLVDRARLLEVLRGRFDRRLTVVRGGAGFGKTTLLAHAIAENLLDPFGTDVWLQVGELDRRRDHLLGGLHHAVGAVFGDDVESGSGDDGDIGELVEKLWALAPEPIAMFVDDAHLLDGTDAAPVLAELCSQLPANVHLVVGSRTMPAVPFRQLQARGDGAEIDEMALAFTVDEQDEFARLRHCEVATDEIPSWPALAVLMTSVGRAASIEYLWEAVLGSLDPDHQAALATLVRFGRVDDEIVGAVCGPGTTAAMLLHGLPLVETREGSFRFHDLWRDALADLASEHDWKRAMVAGAEVMVARGEILRGARCLQTAGADDEVIRLARDFAVAPLAAGLDASVASALIDCLPPRERTGALARYLQVIASTMQSEDALHQFREVQGRAGDDIELASLALWRQTQMFGDIDPQYRTAAGVDQLVTDVTQMAEDGWPLARCALALINSHRAEQLRDVAGALAAVADFEMVAEPELTRVSTASRYIALGHPELVSVTLDEVLAEGIRDPVHAQAVWMTGSIDPTFAWTVTRDLPRVYSRRELDVVNVPLLGVLTSVALAAGELREARTLADEALVRARALQPIPALFARVADAVVALATEGDEAARSRFASIVSDVPVAPWPAWAYMGAITTVRALVSDTEWLDDIDFGSSITTAVAAGRAIVELRVDADATGALALPWRSVELLRVHVPPSLLCELALAAGDVPAARECLDSIPDAARWVRRLVEHHVPAVRTRARALTSGVPQRPPYDLTITTLGEFTVRRSDGGAVSDRVRGGRVEQLVARLLVERTPHRSAIAARLWPDLSEKQAGANLRVTLASLLDAIEPDRPTGTSWFVSTQDGRLELLDDGVDVDLWTFEKHAAAARDAERGSRLMIALDHHRAVLDLYTGPLLPDVDDEDINHLRLRLQTLAFNSGCRVAELLLARGEPEAALGAALAAARIDPLAERARRAEIRAHLTLGSLLGARSTARHLRAQLGAEGLSPERETLMLLERLSS